jgi:hypothetical protein
VKENFILKRGSKKIDRFVGHPAFACSDGKACQEKVTKKKLVKKKREISK